MSGNGPDVWSPGVAIGSLDWAGGYAPAGGTHTGIAVLTFVDGLQFTVAHSIAECLAKISVGAEPSNPGSWVSFDLPNQAVPVVLDVSRIAPGGVGPIIAGYPSPDLYPSPYVVPGI